MYVIFWKNTTKFVKHYYVSEAEITNVCMYCTSSQESCMTVHTPFLYVGEGAQYTEKTQEGRREEGGERQKQIKGQTNQMKER